MAKRSKPEKLDSNSIKLEGTKKETFHYTVGQLVEILKSLPQDLPILTSGYESGFENLHKPEIMKLKHEPESRYYDGEFQSIDEKNEDTFDAVVLQRVVRGDE